ncbi:MAG TPA: hypothetical protein VL405_01325 [Sphingomonas sp.]|nr:hypothetical protein [Sphingomonas sp.]
MFWKPEFSIPADGSDDFAGVRDELREIARQLRALSDAPPPRMPDLLADQIRAQIERIQMPRAAA